VTKERIPVSLRSRLLISSSRDVVNKYRRSRSLRRKVDDDDDVCRRITNLLPTSANAVKLRGKYIARKGPTEVSRQSESFLPTLIAFPAADRIISLWFTAFPSSFLLPLLLPLLAITPTPFALSLHLLFATWSHCSCNFHASKATDTPV